MKVTVFRFGVQIAYRVIAEALSNCDPTGEVPEGVVAHPPNVYPGIDIVPTVAKLELRTVTPSRPVTEATLGVPLSDAPDGALVAKVMTSLPLGVQTAVKVTFAAGMV
jgi:hypothetical protein